MLLFKNSLLCLISLNETKNWGESMLEAQLMQNKRMALKCYEQIEWCSRHLRSIDANEWCVENMALRFTKCFLINDFSIKNVLVSFSLFTTIRIVSTGISGTMHRKIEIRFFPLCHNWNMKIVDYNFEKKNDNRKHFRVSTHVRCTCIRMIPSK